MTRPKRIRRGRYPGADPHVLAYLQGDPCPDGVQLSAQAREAITSIKFFGDFKFNGQLVDEADLDAVPEDQRDHRWYAA